MSHLALLSLVKNRSAVTAGRRTHFSSLLKYLERNLALFKLSSATEASDSTKDCNRSGSLDRLIMLSEETLCSANRVIGRWTFFSPDALCGMPLIKVTIPSATPS